MVYKSDYNAFLFSKKFGASCRKQTLEARIQAQPMNGDTNHRLRLSLSPQIIIQTIFIKANADAALA